MKHCHYAVHISQHDTNHITKMPFFSRREPEEELPPPEPYHEEERKRGPGLLSSLRRDRDPSPTPTTSTQATDSTRRTSTTYRTSPTHNDGASSIFSRSTSTSTRGGGLLRKFGANEELDPSIIQARERMMSAETAEREADRALELARREVKDAREEVKRLEVEAKEEARRAKIKAYHAKEVSKRGKALGRKFDIFTDTVDGIRLTNIPQATTFDDGRHRVAIYHVPAGLCQDTLRLCDLCFQCTMFIARERERELGDGFNLYTNNLLCYLDDPCDEDMLSSGAFSSELCQIFRLTHESGCLHFHSQTSPSVVPSSPSCSLTDPDERDLSSVCMRLANRRRAIAYIL